jgi:GxxExxY protein
VEGRVVVEVKAVDAIHPIHEAQLLSYMRLSGIGVGLLINFNGLQLRATESSGWSTAKIG